MKPRISVVMPVFNGERYLHEAIDSILTQSYQDFEFIIIDDGSTDHTKEILDSYHDPRIIRITHHQNLGIVSSLNEGVAVTQGVYIARMDADDISTPERLEHQCNYLDEHPDIGVLGGNIIEINTQSKQRINKTIPETDILIRWQMCFSNPIVHPTAMVRVGLLKEVNCYSNYKASEDYDLWQRISEKSKIANLNEVVLHFRIHGNNISLMPSEYRSKEREIIRQRAILSILGDQHAINWNRFWNDNNYASMVIYRLYKVISVGLNQKDKNKIRMDAAQKIYENALAIEKKKFQNKFTTYLLAIYLYPALIQKIYHSMINKMDTTA